VGGEGIALWDCGPDPANSEDITSIVPGICRANTSQLGAMSDFAARSI
jgi:hypothetical protein